MTSNETVPTVQQAWARVMADVQSLGKNQKHDSPGAKFNFRGIDDVMNAVGPVLREHGVMVVPNHVERSHRDVTTSNGRVQRETTVSVQYAIYGPAGDYMHGASCGEAADSGDKGTPKAMSVAFRTFLLQSLCLPTDEPDPDSHAMERGSTETPEQKAKKVADGLPAVGAVQRLKAVEEWSKERDLLGVPVTDTEGNSLPLGKLIERHYARLGETPDAMAKAEADLRDRLGAEKVSEEKTEEPAS